MATNRLADFALFDPAHLNVNGLFIPKLKDKNNQQLRKFYGKYNGGDLEFWTIQLTAEHQSLLLAIAARTRIDGSQYLPNTTDATEAKLRADLKLEDAAQTQPNSIVEVSAFQLLQECGMSDSKKTYDKLEELLTILSMAIIRYKRGTDSGNSHLMSYHKRGDKLAISLNWRLTAALITGSFSKIDLDERRELSKSPVAKVLHAYLSAHMSHINGGGDQYIHGNYADIDTFIPHIYGNEPYTDDMKRYYRKQIKAALDLLGKLEKWQVDIKKGRVLITRPKALN